MPKPNFYITEESYNRLIGLGHWLIQDLPPDRASQVQPFLDNEDTLAVFASGLRPQPDLSTSGVVGGTDWVRLETHPKPSEPPLNVYHFVIMAKCAGGYPVYACREGKSIAAHWSELTDLHVYYPEI